MKLTMVLIEVGGLGKVLIAYETNKRKNQCHPHNSIVKSRDLEN